MGGSERTTSNHSDAFAVGFAPPKFNSSPPKNDGWKTILSFLGFGLFSGVNSLLNFLAVRFNVSLVAHHLRTNPQTLRLIKGSLDLWSRRVPETQKRVGGQKGLKNSEGFWCKVGPGTDRYKGSSGFCSRIISSLK